MTATHVDTRDVPVGLVDEHPGQPRAGDLDATATALDANGQHRSIVVRAMPDGRYAALVGWDVAEAATALGWATVRADVIECDDDTAARIIAADIGTSRSGGYDPEALAVLLTAAGDLTGTGYSARELDALTAATRDGTGLHDDGGPDLDQLAETAPASAGADGGTRTETNLHERAEKYATKGTRTFVVEYPLDEFQTVTARFGDLRRLTGTDTNAAALLGALTIMTGEDPPP